MASPLTPHEIEQEISRLVNLLEERTEEYATIAHEAALAEADYRVAYARAFINMAGTVREREEGALLECEKLLYSRLASDARRDSSGRALASLRSQLDSLRSLSASVRGQV